MDSSQGLYWISTKDSNGTGGTNLLNLDDKLNIQVIPYTGTDLINTVDDNGSGNTQRSYLKTQLAHNLQKIVRRPHTKEYKRYVANKNMI